jgi:hypothetical protein
MAVPPASLLVDPRPSRYLANNSSPQRRGTRLSIFRWLESRERALSPPLTTPNRGEISGLLSPNLCSAGLMDPTRAEEVFTRIPPHEARASGYMAVSPSSSLEEPRPSRYLDNTPPKVPDKCHASRDRGINPSHRNHTGGSIPPPDDTRLDLHSGRPSIPLPCIEPRSPTPAGGGSSQQGGP